MPAHFRYSFVSIKMEMTLNKYVNFWWGGKYVIVVVVSACNKDDVKHDGNYIFIRRQKTV